MVVVVAQLVLKPVQPVVKAGAGGGRHLQHLDAGVDAPRQLDAARHVELHMRQQVDLVQDHEPGGGEHVGVLERLVLALGDGQDRHLGALTQIPQRRADQVADIFDEQQAGSGVFVAVGVCMAVPDAVRVLVAMIVAVFMNMGMALLMAVLVQLRKSRRHHGRVEVAALAGVDLDRGRAGGADALGVEGGLLVAFDHRHRQRRVALAQRLDGGAEQGGFARSGAGHQVQRQHPVGRKVLPVVRGDAVVGAQNVVLELDRPRLAQTRHRDPGRTGAVVEVATARVDARTRFGHRGIDGGGRGLGARLCQRLVQLRGRFVAPGLAASTYDTHGSNLLGWGRLAGTISHQRGGPRRPARSIIAHLQVEHAQFHAPGGLEQVTRAGRAGVAALGDRHTRVATQTPSLPRGLDQFDACAVEPRTRRDAVEGKAQRRHIDPSQLPNLEAQFKHTGKALALRAVIDQLQHAPGEAGFMHGACLGTQLI